MLIYSINCIFLIHPLYKIKMKLSLLFLTFLSTAFISFCQPFIHFIDSAVGDSENGLKQGEWRVPVVTGGNEISYVFRYEPSYVFRNDTVIKISIKGDSNRDELNIDYKNNQVTWKSWYKREKGKKFYLWKIEIFTYQDSFLYKLHKSYVHNHLVHYENYERGKIEWIKKYQLQNLGHVSERNILASIILYDSKGEIVEQANRNKTPNVCTPIDSVLCDSIYYQDDWKSMLEAENVAFKRSLYITDYSEFAWFLDGDFSTELKKDTIKFSLNSIDNTSSHKTNQYLMTNWISSEFYFACFSYNKLNNGTQASASSLKAFRLTYKSPSIIYLKGNSNQGYIRKRKTKYKLEWTGDYCFRLIKI
jgi:hypothetical protein